MLGGRGIVLRRLRARSTAGGELALPSFTAAAAGDPLDPHTLEAIAAGISMRRYGRSLDPLLVERGLATERRLLFVIDGAKALRKALRESFGDLAVVQRCQVHRLRLQRLGIQGALYRTLRSTNAIENLNGSVATTRATGRAGGAAA